MKKVYLLLLLPLSPVFVLTIRLIQFLKIGKVKTFVKSMILAIIEIFVFIIVLPAILVDSFSIQNEIFETIYLYVISSIISVLLIRGTENNLKSDG